MKISRSLAHDCCLVVKHLAAALSGELSCPQIFFIYLQLTSAIFTFNVHCFRTQIHIFTMWQIDLPTPINSWLLSEGKLRLFYSHAVN